MELNSFQSKSVQFSSVQSLDLSDIVIVDSSNVVRKLDNVADVLSVAQNCDDDATGSLFRRVLFGRNDQQTRCGSNSAACVVHISKLFFLIEAQVPA